MSAPCLLVVDDDGALRRLLGDRFRAAGYAVAEAADGRSALAAVAGGGLDAVILDLRLPDLDGLEVLRRLPAGHPPVILLTAHGSIERAVEAMREGAEDFLVKPGNPAHLQLVVERALQRRRRDAETAVLREDRRRRRRLVTGGDPAMQAILETARRAAGHPDATVLIEGESGTGKEVLAWWIHEHSPRAAGPFVHVDCAGLAETLVASDLFGHERGAFTGADRRKLGRVEVAAGGTLFLDEVGELPLELQARLLRFAQSGEFERLGDPRPRRVDARILAATNRDLEGAVRKGRFREDLYYRLAVVRLKLPPLRERRADIPELARHFAALHAARAGRPAPELPPETLAALQAQDWPGNVRELANAIQRALILGGEGPLRAADLLAGPAGGGEAAPGGGRPLEEAERGFRRRYLEQALAAAGGNQSRAAEALGISRPYLNRLLKELGLR